MNKTFIILAVVLGLTACGGGSTASTTTTPAATAESSVATSATPMMNFIVGSWVSHGETETRENWVRSSETSLSGQGTVTAGGQLVYSETTAIESRDGNIVYVANPSGQATTMFTLVRATDNELVFENPSHDYPQRIVYSRSGDSLVTKVSLVSGEREQTNTLERADAGAPQAQ